MAEELWTKVAEIRAKGGTPQIRLTRAMLVIPPKGKAGRPKVEKPLEPYAHLLQRELWGGSRRVRCLRPLCRARLKQSDAFACCPAHKEHVINLLHRVFQIILGRGHLRIPRVKEANIVSTGSPGGPYSNNEYAKRLSLGRGRPPGRGGKPPAKGADS